MFTSTPDLNFASQYGGDAPEVRKDAGWDELISSSYEQTKRGHELLSHNYNLMSAYEQRIRQAKDLTGVELENPRLMYRGRTYDGTPMTQQFWKDYEEHTSSGGPTLPFSEFASAWGAQNFEKQLRDLALQHPEHAATLLGQTDVRNQAYELRQEADRRAANVAERSSGGAHFIGSAIGGIGAMATDPFQLATLPLFPHIKAGAGVWGLTKSAVIAGGANAAIETAQQPWIQAYNAQSGARYGWTAAAEDVAMAGLFGAGIDGAFRGATRGISRLRGYQPVVVDGYIVGWRKGRPGDAAPRIEPELTARAKTGDVAAQDEIAKRADTGDGISVRMLDEANKGNPEAMRTVAEKVGVEGDPLVRQAIHAAEADAATVRRRPAPDVIEPDHETAARQAVAHVSDPVNIVPPVRVGETPPATGWLSKIREDLAAAQKELRIAYGEDLKGAKGVKGVVQVASGGRIDELTRTVEALKSRLDEADRFGQDPIATAKAFRERPQLVTQDLNFGEAGLRKARNLAALSDEAFQRVTSGDVHPDIAALVAESVLDTTKHARVMDDLLTRQPQSEAQARIALADILSSPDHAPKPIAEQRAQAEDDVVRHDGDVPKRERQLDDPYGPEAKAQLAALERKYAEELGQPAEREGKGQGEPSRPGDDDDLRFMFAGEKGAQRLAEAGSPTVRAMLGHAKKLQDRGVSTARIWKNAGWIQGADRKWRFEIDDSKATFTEPPAKVTKLANFRDKVLKWFRVEINPAEKEQLRLSDVMDHQDLYRAYPVLRDLRVAFVDDLGGALGQASIYRSPDGKLKLFPVRILSPKKNPQWKSALLHEVQHYVQEMEGFAAGTAPNPAKPAPDKEKKEKPGKGQDGKRPALFLGSNLTFDDLKNRDSYLFPKTKVESLFNDYVVAYEKGDAEAVRKAQTEIMRRTRVGKEEYLREAGETEARDTQARQFLTSQERRAQPPDVSGHAGVSTRDPANIMAELDRRSGFERRYRSRKPEPVPGVEGLTVRPIVNDTHTGDAVAYHLAGQRDPIVILHSYAGHTYFIPESGAIAAHPDAVEAAFRHAQRASNDEITIESKDRGLSRSDLMFWARVAPMLVIHDMRLYEEPMLKAVKKHFGPEYGLYFQDRFQSVALAKDGQPLSYRDPLQEAFYQNVVVHYLPQISEDVRGLDPKVRQVKEWQDLIDRVGGPTGIRLEAGDADLLFSLRQRRDIDDLGYYSQALEAAKAIKQAKGTPEQMLAQLKTAGVRQAEIDATGLGDLMAGKQSVTRDEIVKHLEKRRIELIEVNHNKHQDITKYVEEKMDKWRRDIDASGRFNEDFNDKKFYDSRDAVHERVAKWLKSQGVEGEFETPEDAIKASGAHVYSGIIPIWKEFDGRYYIIEAPNKKVFTTSEFGDLHEEFSSKTEAIKHLEDEAVQTARSHADEYEAKRRFTKEAEDVYEGTDLTKYSKYSLDPQNPTYRETILHLPEMRGGDIRGDDLNFRGGHFDERNIVGHMQTSMTTHGGRPVYTIDQIQSDWGQSVRDKGLKGSPEQLARDAALRAEADKVRAEYDDIMGKVAPVMSKINAAIRENPAFRDKNILQIAAEIGQDVVAFDANRKRMLEIEPEMRRLQAEVRQITSDRGVAGHPLVNTTDQWTNTTLRRAIRQAVDAGADYIAVPHGDTVLSYNPGDEAGMRGFYGSRSFEGIVPKNLRKLLEKIDKKSPRPTKVETLETPSGERGYRDDNRHNRFDRDQTGFTLFPLTDKVKQAVRDEGQPLFKLGDGSSGAPKAAVQDRAMDIAQALVQGELRQMAHLFPADVRIKLLEPGGLGDRVDGAWRAKDATMFIAMTAADKGAAVRHELVHAYRSLGLLAEGEWGALKAKAAEVLTPEQAARIERQYGEAYKDRGLTPEQLADRIEEEKVAFLVEERWRRGRSFGETIDAVIDRIVELIERVRNALGGHGFTSFEDVIRRIESGEVANREAGTAVGDVMLSMRDQNGRTKQGAQQRAQQLQADLAEIEKQFQASSGDERIKLQAKRAALLNAQGQEKVLDDLGTFRSVRGVNDQALGFLTMHETSNELHSAPFMDLKHQRDVIQNQALGMIEKAVWTLRKGAVSGDLRRKLTHVKTTMENAIREAAGEATNDPIAKEIAKGWGEAAEYLRKRFNAAGGDIGKLATWIMPQYHDVEALIKVGREKWIEYLMTPGTLDRRAMVDHTTGTPLTDAELRAGLREAYTSIITDGANKFDPEIGAPPAGRSALYKRRMDHRFIHFASADAWIKYQRELGGGDLYAAMIGHISTMSRDIAAMERFGANPNIVRERIKAQIMGNAKRTLPLRSLLAEIEERIAELDAKVDGTLAAPDKAWSDQMRELSQERQAVRVELIKGLGAKSKAEKARMDALHMRSLDILDQQVRLYDERIKGDTPGLRKMLAELGELRDEVDAARSLPITAGDPQAHAAAMIKRADDVWKSYMGASNVPVDSNLASAMVGLRNITSAATLVYAGLSTLADQATGIAGRLYIGMPATQQLMSFVKGFSGGARQDALHLQVGLEQAANAFHEGARMGAAINTRHLTGYIADRSHAYSMMTPMTQASKTAFSLDFLHWMTTLQSKRFGQLPKPAQRMLMRHGLTPEDWIKLRRVEPEIVRGVPYLSRDAIEKAFGLELAERYMAMLFRERSMAVIEPTAKGRTLYVSDTQPGSVVGELLRSGAMMKSFSTSYMMLVMGRLYGDIVQGRYQSAAVYGAANVIIGTLLGAMIIQMKHIAQGRDAEDVRKGGFWARSFMQAGGAGIYGDLIASSVNRNGQGLAETLAGPAIGLMATGANLITGNIAQYASDEKTNAGREAVNLLRKSTPGMIVPFYLRIAYDRMILDELQKRVDPDAYKVFAQKTQARRKLTGNEFYWPPGADSPLRGPKFSTAIGAP